MNRAHIELSRSPVFDSGQENYQWDGNAWPFQTMAFVRLVGRKHSLFTVLGHWEECSVHIKPATASGQTMQARHAFASKVVESQVFNSHLS